MLSSLNSEKIATNLLRADWLVTVTEFILIRFVLTLASFLVAWLISGSILSGAGLAMIVYLVPGIYMRRKIS